MHAVPAYEGAFLAESAPSLRKLRSAARCNKLAPTLTRHQMLASEAPDFVHGVAGEPYSTSMIEVTVWVDNQDGKVPWPLYPKPGFPRLTRRARAHWSISEAVSVEIAARAPRHEVDSKVPGITSKGNKGAAGNVLEMQLRLVEMLPA